MVSTLLGLVIHDWWSLRDVGTRTKVIDDNNGGGQREKVKCETHFVENRDMCSTIESRLFSGLKKWVSKQLIDVNRLLMHRKNSCHTCSL
jgi:hypothetical protein